MKKNVESLRDSWDTMKRNDIYIMEVKEKEKEEERKEKEESLFEKMAKNFPKFENRNGYKNS